MPEHMDRLTPQRTRELPSGKIGAESDTYLLPIDQVIHGNALEVLKNFPDNSVDAIVTDPPAGINFMSAKWDNPDTFYVRPPTEGVRPKGTPEHGAHKNGDGFAKGIVWDSSKRARDAFIAFMTSVMAECLRVLKPGGHALVWSLPRTSHWTGYALEEAGFEVRDIITHIFGQGFPKSKSMKDIGHPELGSALKPACEYWWLVRKPLVEKSIAAQVLATGTGALNIDACRIGESDGHGGGRNAASGFSGIAGYAHDGFSPSQHGRWPANLLLSHTLFCEQREEEATDWICDPLCPVHILDLQSGVRKSGARNGPRLERRDTEWAQRDTRLLGGVCESSEGFASRFFQQFPAEALYLYCSKSSRTERNAGCEELPEMVGFNKNTSKVSQRIDPGTGIVRYSDYNPHPQSNTHPTVKPLTLLRYLIRLICPPDGIVLDCFGGSGSTAVACIQEHAHYVLVEQDVSYVAIAEARICNARGEEGLWASGMSEEVIYG